MKFGVIAAGEGSRLANDGVSVPKPLVRLNGEPMIDRLIRIFAANNASSVSVIVNGETDEVYAHLRAVQPAVPLHIVQKSTPSSMHSFYELSSMLAREKFAHEKDGFCLTTVDTVFREDEFAQFIRAYDSCTDDGLMAVTGYIDDEKPLYVETAPNGIIKGFYDDNGGGRMQYVSGGIYCLDSRSISVLRASVEAGASRMRNFQRQLVRDGWRLRAWPFSKIIDVDHLEDVHKAEIFLQQH